MIYKFHAISVKILEFFYILGNNSIICQEKNNSVREFRYDKVWEKEELSNKWCWVGWREFKRNPNPYPHSLF